MNPPSVTERTRSRAGSKASVIEIVERRDALLIEMGTVYGPPPTRTGVPGGVTTTIAAPNPAVVTGASVAACWPGGGVAGAGGAAGDGGSGVTGVGNGVGGGAV